VLLRRLGTDQLSASQIQGLRALLWSAFGDEDDRFTEEDWQHALGGQHFVVEIDGRIVSHASVVERVLHVDGQPLRTGYVEAVATEPQQQRRGHGSTVMTAVNEHIREGFELGALGTSSHGFYERLGWQTWRGPTSVRTAAGELATPDEDGYILVLRTPTTPALDIEAPISCDWRPGDVW